MVIGGFNWPEQVSLILHQQTWPSLEVFIIMQKHEQKKNLHIYEALFTDEITKCFKMWK